MNAFLIFKCLGLTIFALFFKSATADLNKSYHFPGFAKDSNFSSDIVVYGDAKAVNGGQALQLTSPESSGAGGVLYRKPIKLAGGNNKTVASFSTCFSFSVSPDNGDGLSFVIFPARLHAKQNSKTLAVRFRSLRSGNFAEINARIELKTHVSITTISKATTRSYNLGISRRFHSWIDYEVGTKRLDLRVADDVAHRPSNPLLSSTIDFFQIFRDDMVFVGLSCSNKKSRQKCLVYSFNFSLHPIKKLVHSQPLNPEDFKFEKKMVAQVRGNNRFMSVFAALVFGSCCGALAASTALCLWSVFGRRRCVTKASEEIQPQDIKDEKNQSFR